MKNDKQLRDFVKEYRIQYIARLWIYLHCSPFLLLLCRCTIVKIWESLGSQSKSLASHHRVLEFVLKSCPVRFVVGVVTGIDFYRVFILSLSLLFYQCSILKICYLCCLIVTVDIVIKKTTNTIAINHGLCKCLFRFSEVIQHTCCFPSFRHFAHFTFFFHPSLSSR